MLTVNLNEIEATISKYNKANVVLTKYYNSPAIKCTMRPTSEQYEDEAQFDAVKAAQRAIVGDAFQEFYTETTFSEWYIYLKRIPIEFVFEDKKHA